MLDNIKRAFSNKNLTTEWQMGRLFGTDILSVRDLYDILYICDWVGLLKVLNHNDNLQEAELIYKAIHGETESDNGSKIDGNSVEPDFRINSLKNFLGINKKIDIVALLSCWDALSKVNQRMSFYWKFFENSGDDDAKSDVSPRSKSKESPPRDKYSLPGTPESDYESSESDLIPYEDDYSLALINLYKPAILIQENLDLSEIRKKYKKIIVDTISNKGSADVITDYIVDESCFYDVFNFSYDTFQNFYKTIFESEEKKSHEKYRLEIKNLFLSKVLFSLYFENKRASTCATDFFAGNFNYILLEWLVECYLDKGYYSLLSELLDQHCKDLRVSKKDLLKHCLSAGDMKLHYMRLGRGHILDCLRSEHLDLLSLETEKEIIKNDDKALRQRIEATERFISWVENHSINYRKAYDILDYPLLGYEGLIFAEKVMEEAILGLYQNLENVAEENSLALIKDKKHYADKFMRFQAFIKSYCGYLADFGDDHYDSEFIALIKALSVVFAEGYDVNKTGVLKCLEKYTITFPTNKRISPFLCIPKWCQELKSLVSPQDQNGVLKATPLIIFDQSEQDIYDENSQYLKLMGELYSAVFIHVSMDDVKLLVNNLNKVIGKALNNKKIDISALFYEKLATEKERVGYGRCRNISFMLGPMLHMAYENCGRKVVKAESLIDALDSDAIKKVFWQTLSGKCPVWMFDDDGTPMPGFAFGMTPYLEKNSTVLVGHYGRDTTTLRVSGGMFSGVFPFVKEKFYPGIAMALFKYSGFCFPSMVGGEEGHNAVFREEDIYSSQLSQVVQQTGMRHPLLEGGDVIKSAAVAQQALMKRSLGQDIGYIMQRLWLSVPADPKNPSSRKRLRDFYRVFTNSDSKITERTILKIFEFLLEERFKIQAEALSIAEDTQLIKRLFSSHFMKLYNKDIDSNLKSCASHIKAYAYVVPMVVDEFLQSIPNDAVKLKKLLMEKKIDIKKVNKLIVPLRESNAKFLKGVTGNKNYEQYRGGAAVAAQMAEYLYEWFDKLCLGGMFEIMEICVSFAKANSHKDEKS